MSRAVPKPPPLYYRSPWKKITQYELVAAGVLAVSSFTALAIANIPLLAPYFHALRTLPITVSLGPLHIAMPLQQWVNDVLMCSFFFMVGLQIKYELLAGRLRSPRAAALPILGAFGGMIVPILTFVVVNKFFAGNEDPTRMTGWAIPMSTDIAFAAGCMSLLRRRVPPGLYVFLITLAIVDDLGAVAVIGVMHLESLRLAWFVPGLGIIVLAWMIGRAGIQSATFFLALGGMVWACFVMSGIHATVAGVLMAIAIPMRSQCLAEDFLDRTGQLLQSFRDAGRTSETELVNNQEQVVVRSLVRECFYVESALQRILYGLEPFCSLVVLPVFAFVNSGLTFDWANMSDLLRQPVTIGVLLGLLFGKQLGITLFCWISSLLGAAQLPEGVKLRQLWALSWLGGIGFTMALFLSELAYTSSAMHEIPITVGPEMPVAALAHTPVYEEDSALATHNEEAKTGIFLASGMSAGIGLALLLLLCPRVEENGAPPV